MRRQGLSLVEVTFVLVILAVVSIYYVINSVGALDSGKAGRAAAEISQLSSAVSRYHYDMRSYPATLAALKNNTPYGDGSPWVTSSMFPSTDPWGRSCSAGSGYCYAFTDTGFSIWCMGKGGTNDSGSGTTFSGDDFGVFGK